MTKSFAFPVLLCAFWACGPTDERTLCERNFEPYPDLISGRVGNQGNAPFLEGMSHYAAKDYPGAVDKLKTYLQKPDASPSAHLYLACSYIAIGQPYDAELEIDHLENSNLEGFEDQCEWYTVLCWLCSDQRDRALEGAKTIADAQRHTYKNEAKRLAEELNRTLAQ